MRRLNEIQDSQNFNLKILLINEFESITTLTSKKVARFHRISLFKTRYKIENVFDEIHKIRI